MTEARDHVVYAFGPFLLDSRERRLLRDGQPVPLTIKAFDLLEVLAQNDGRLLRKEELLRLVWSDAVVEENNLTVTVSALRKAPATGIVSWPICGTWRTSATRGRRPARPSRR